MTPEIVEAGSRYCASVHPHWPDDAIPENVPRYGKRVRLLALIVVIALVLLTVVPVLVRVTRPAPTTTQPGIVAVEGSW